MLWDNQEAIDKPLLAVIKQEKIWIIIFLYSSQHRRISTIQNFSLNFPFLAFKLKFFTTMFAVKIRSRLVVFKFL